MILLMFDLVQVGLVRRQPHVERLLRRHLQRNLAFEDVL